MKILKEEVKLCFSCMENHVVRIVEIEELVTFKGEKVAYKANYEYCSDSESFSENNEQLKQNDLILKEAYRIKLDLLTSYEIKKIREKYDVIQK